MTCGEKDSSTTEIARKYWKRNRIRLEVLPDGIIQVTAPFGCDIRPFVEQKRAWIEKRIQERQYITRDHSAGDDLLLLQGRWYPLTQGSSDEIREDGVTYTTPAGLKDRLTGLLRRDVEEQIQKYAHRLGCTVKTVFIRSQKTRWGSCSGEATLNFNLALMALPPKLRVYVILHELVHLVERNHQPAFWKRLETLCPEYRTCRKELKVYGILVERNSIWRVLRDG